MFVVINNRMIYQNIFSFDIKIDRLDDITIDVWDETRKDIFRKIINKYLTFVKKVL